MSLEPGLKTLLQVPEFQLSRPPAGVTAAELRAAAVPMPPFPMDDGPRGAGAAGPGAGRHDRRTALPAVRSAHYPPLIVHFHGGGFVFCNLDTHEPLCRTLAARSGCAVVSVDYRLAPEHPFPIPLEDCYHATQWLVATPTSWASMRDDSPSPATAQAETWRSACAALARERRGAPGCVTRRSSIRSPMPRATTPPGASSARATC